MLLEIITVFAVIIFSYWNFVFFFDFLSLSIGRFDLFTDFVVRRRHELLLILRSYLKNSILIIYNLRIFFYNIIIYRLFLIFKLIKHLLLLPDLFLILFQISYINLIFRVHNRLLQLFDWLLAVRIGIVVLFEEPC